MRFLTRSYVDWLGLDDVPIKYPQHITRGYSPVSLGGTLAPAGSRPFHVGVILGGVTYRREDDGLAYERVESREEYIQRRRAEFAS